MSVGNQVEICGFTEIGYRKRSGAIAANTRGRFRSVPSIRADNRFHTYYSRASFAAPAYLADRIARTEDVMDKVVVVTGASAGIGAELAKQLAAKGAKVVLAARRKEELDAVAKGIGEHALAVVTDVTKKSDVERLAKAAVERFGRIDVWVNNAGRGISRSVADLTDEDLDAMWTVNMKSVVYGIQAVLPHFKSKNAGQIINVSSGLSRAPLAPVRAAYGAVKGAVNMLTASLRVELKVTHPGIHVTFAGRRRDRVRH
jgi:NAD(P)-dependent dehydrogenase (short-subunit alcohol dehydrogenase family)